MSETSPAAKGAGQDPQFILKFYQGRDLRFGDVPLDGTVRVGRSRDNTVVLNHASVSRFHATFLVEQVNGSPVVVLRDEGSKNGCIVNGRPIHGTEVVVKPGDCIQLGVFLVDLSLLRPPRPHEHGEDPDGDIVFAVLPSSPNALPDERLRVLYELVGRVDQLAEETLLPAIAASIAATLPFSVLYLALEADDGSPLLYACTPNGPCSVSEISISRTLISKCHGEGVAVLSGTGAIAAGQDPAAVFKSLKSAMCVPFTSATRSTGIIYASSPVDRTYSREDLQFLILVASSVSHQIVAARALGVLRDEKEKLERILASLQEGVLLLDHELRVLHSNAAAAQIFGSRDVTGVRIDEALAGFRRSFKIEAFSQLSSFEISEDPAAASEGANGLPRVYEGRISKGDAAGPASWKYIVCLHDISQTRHMERLKAVFLNRLAHKIVTPLTVVSSVNVLLGDHIGRLNDPELDRLLRQSVKESEQCAHLIRQLVDYTAMSFGGGTSALNCASCSVAGLVENAILAAGDLVAAKDFSVDTRIAPDAAAVCGDSTQLGLVFFHLLQNAIKFGREKGRVEVGTEAQDKVVKVSFLDDGPGIPPEEMRNVGQMFYQVDPQNTGEIPGAGIGLWLVREIVRCHRGEVHLSSPALPDGTGTLVEIRLPLDAARELDSRPVPAGETALLPHGAPLDPVGV